MGNQCTCVRTKVEVPESNMEEKTTPLTIEVTKADSPKKSSPKAPVSMADFEKIKIIGKGAFGKVVLCRKKDNNKKMYAVKVMKKHGLTPEDIPRLLAERDMLAIAQNPFVVKLYYAWQNSENLYLAMDFLQGGDLMGLLIDKDIFSAEATQFYIGEITLAIESVHKHGYVHRDLKPDNILLDKYGHIRLTDFGLAKQLTTKPRARVDHSHLSPMPVPKSNLLTVEPSFVSSKRCNRKKDAKILAHSMVGTPNYMAPEIFTHVGYDDKCDFWAIGCIMYECLAGYVPFYEDDQHGTAYSVVHWKETLTLQPVENKEARSLIKGLLCDSDNRLGVKRIKSHPFFKNFDWKNIAKMKSPYHDPTTLKDETDTSYFIMMDEDDEDVTSGATSPADLTHRQLDSFTIDNYLFQIDSKDMSNHCVSDLWANQEISVRRKNRSFRSKRRKR